jgi:hypothetical protein
MQRLVHETSDASQASQILPMHLGQINQFWSANGQTHLIDQEDSHQARDHR